MKISKSRLKNIILEEMQRIDEQEVDWGSYAQQFNPFTPYPGPDQDKSIVNPLYIQNDIGAAEEIARLNPWNEYWQKEQAAPAQAQAAPVEGYGDAGMLNPDYSTGFMQNQPEHYFGSQFSPDLAAAAAEHPMAAEPFQGAGGYTYTEDPQGGYQISKGGKNLGTAKPGSAAFDSINAEITTGTSHWQQPTQVAAKGPEKLNLPALSPSAQWTKTEKL